MIPITEKELRTLREEIINPGGWSKLPFFLRMRLRAWFFVRKLRYDR